jgi:hypothetical protein
VLNDLVKIGTPWAAVSQQLRIESGECQLFHRALMARKHRYEADARDRVARQQQQQQQSVGNVNGPAVQAGVRNEANTTNLSNNNSNNQNTSLFLATPGVSAVHMFPTTQSNGIAPQVTVLSTAAVPGVQWSEDMVGVASNSNLNIQCNISLLSCERSSSVTTTTWTVRRSGSRSRRI